MIPVLSDEENVKKSLPDAQLTYRIRRGRREWLIKSNGVLIAFSFTPDGAWANASLAIQFSNYKNKTT